MRVFTIAFVPAAVTAGIHVVATAWTVAFALYLWRYTPFLMRSRVDGLPG
ncbi:NnrS family protein [Staphylococcus aureus]